MALALRLGVWTTAVAAGLWALGRLLVRQKEQLPPAHAPRAGRLTRVNGVELHHLDQGDGLPALLIPGFGSSAFAFRETVPALAPRFATTIVELPGSGYSDRTLQHDYSLSGHAALLAAFLRARDAQPALVIGHASGGAVALRLAVDYPELVERMVLVGTPDPNDLRALARRARYATPLLPFVTIALAQQRTVGARLLRRLAADARFVTAPVVAGYDRPMRVQGTHAALRRQLTDLARDDRMDLTRVAAPTLLLWGEQDVVVPLRAASRLLDRLPQGHLEVVPQAGHLLLEESPAPANAAILHWLEEGENALARDGGAHGEWR